LEFVTSRLDFESEEAKFSSFFFSTIIRFPSRFLAMFSAITSRVSLSVIIIIFFFFSIFVVPC
tara:strand:+ start:1065 stop:1253 length:189 start_codon:yes stop_codon:yes gene_type:complete